MFSKIDSIEYYLPPRNKFFSPHFKKIYEKTGIKNTRIKKINEDVIDLAYKACLKHKNKIKKIDAIIFVTQTPRYLLPSCSCILQDKLKFNHNIYTLDINMGCSGYIYGLSVADSLIKNNIANNVLLVCSDTYSKYIDKKNTNKYIFSDSASATLIKKSNSNKIYDYSFFTNGSKHDSIIIKKEKNIETFSMNGTDVFAFTLEQVPLNINKYLKRYKRNLSFYEQVFFHQASGIILENIKKKFNTKKIYKDIKDIGNTTSSSIPISIKNAQKKKIIKKDDNLLLCGFGVGLSLGIVSIKV
jgi:3-oxoacyl-[acyl-carrier-protein] synthase-3